ncbi:hypothetical protein ACSBR2_030746 [Camellia fascicularis]
MQMTNMFREMEIRGRMAIPTKSLDRNGVVPQSSVVTGLLKELLLIKSTEEHGYFLAITELKSIGNGEFEDESGEVLFSVTFHCRTFLPVNGEIMLVVVHKIHRRGVFLRCGPMKYIYLSVQKMPNFYYAQWKAQEIFISDDHSRIENDVVIRFVVFAVRWRKKHWDIERDFMILASLEDDCLGPVSLLGFYESRVLQKWCRTSTGYLLGAGTLTDTTVRIPGTPNTCRVPQIHLDTSWVRYGYGTGTAK